MERGEANYGLVKTSNFLPTVSALRYLNCCRTVGWHNCNKLYHLKYEKGVAIVFLVYTVKGAGRIRAAVPEETSKSWVLTEGTLCMIPADTPMEYGTLGSGDEDFWEFYWLNLDGDYVRRTAEKLFLCLLGLLHLVTRNISSRFFIGCCTLRFRKSPGKWNIPA